MGSLTGFVSKALTLSHWFLSLPWWVALRRACCLESNVTAIKFPQEAAALGDVIRLETLMLVLILKMHHRSRLLISATAPAEGGMGLTSVFIFNFRENEVLPCLSSIYSDTWSMPLADNPQKCQITFISQRSRWSFSSHSDLRTDLFILQLTSDQEKTELSFSFFPGACWDAFICSYYYACHHPHKNRTCFFCVCLCVIISSSRHLEEILSTSFKSTDFYEQSITSLI